MAHLLRKLSALASSHAPWRIIKANLDAGVIVGLHSSREILEFAKGCDLGAKLDDCLRSSGDPVADINAIFTGVVRRRRYAGPASEVRRQDRVEAIDLELPCAFDEDETLSGQVLYRVVKHTSLVEMIGTDNEFWRREEVADLDIAPLPGHATAEEIGEWCTSLGSLPEAQRRFVVGAGNTMAAGIVWFTRVSDVPFDWNASPSSAHAKSARDLLGLVHFLPAASTGRAWLFALRFPGDAADRVGHYRPSAFDALDNARFMVPRNHSGGEDIHWGSTAHLAHIDDGTLSIEGAPERVANQIRSDDLGGNSVEFAYLGELADAHDVPDEQFAQRLEEL